MARSGTDTSAKPQDLHGRGDRMLIARLPLGGGQPQVLAGPGVSLSQHGDTRAYLYGLPYFREPWLDAKNVALRWHEDSARVLRVLDGMFLLLIVTPGEFFLVNDKVSPLTWFWVRESEEVIASNGLRTLLERSGVPLAFDYPAFRQHIYSRALHYDCCVAKGVGKLLKGQLLARDLRPRFYYRLTDHLEAATPAEYFNHLRDYIRQVFRGKKVAVLASNGFDSRMSVLLLTECLDHVDLFTMRSDIYSEHRSLRRFLSSLSRSNYRLHTFGYSMASGSPYYALRRLKTHTKAYLSCFDDLTENKEQLLFAEVFDRLHTEGYEVLTTGVMGGDVRRVLPIHIVNNRSFDLDASGTPRTRALFGMSDQQVAEYHDPATHSYPDWAREHAGHGQISYTGPLLLNLGVAQVAMPVPTARAMELYRGIDRTTLPGKGGINFYREFIAGQVPGAPPVPFDTGIAFHVPCERRPWLREVLDLDFIDATLRTSGIFDHEFLDLMRSTYGVQRPPYAGSHSYLNLWAWYTVVTGQPGLFERSLEPLIRKDPYFRPNGPRRTAAITTSRVLVALLLLMVRIVSFTDHRHAMHRAAKAVSRSARRGAYRVGSAGYGVLRRLLRLPPWEQLRKGG